LAMLMDLSSEVAEVGLLPASPATSSASLSPCAKEKVFRKYGRTEVVAGNAKDTRHHGGKNLYRRRVSIRMRQVIAG
jgi:hypothetical protein